MWSAYWELDRSEMNGRPLFGSMCAVLDEYGWRDPGVRAAIRSLWRAIWSEEHAVREEKRKKKSDEPGAAEADDE